MANRKKLRKGIIDWKAKVEALSNFFGTTRAYAYTELGFAILARDPEKKESYDEDHSKLVGMLRKYHAHDPEGNVGQLFLSALTERFRERWAERHFDANLSDEDIRALILRGSVDAFVTQLFPPGYAREMALSACQFPLASAREAFGAFDPSSGKLSLPTGNDRFSVSVPYQPHEFIKSSMDIAMRLALKSGRVDQKYHYLTPHAEGNWRAVVNSGVYKQYDECKLALIDVFKTNTWRNFFSGQADGAVMLGCGAGSKDELIVASMIEYSAPDQPLWYGLVDFSFPMLMAALYRINDSLRRQGIVDRLHVIPCNYDFVDGFAGRRAELGRPDRNIAWFLPGGTLGNLDEDRFFSSLADESKPGDLLVVGVETVASGETQPDTETLTRKYDTPEVRQFVEEPFQSLLRAADISVAPSIKVDAVPNKKKPYNPYSEVPGSVTVEVSTTVDKKNVALLTSTRYDENELVQFAEQRQFERVTVVSSPLNERFKQFVFRRN